MKIFQDHHLYLGCHAMVSRPSGRQAEKITPAMIEHLHTLGQSWDLYKPILRPLSSMTEDEKLELYGMGFTHNKGMQISHPSDWRSFTPMQFQFLLSKGLDLFNLIPEGLAINAETLK